MKTCKFNKGIINYLEKHKAYGPNKIIDFVLSDDLAPFMLKMARKFVAPIIKALTTISGLVGLRD